jgi:hypothetical protein
MEAICSSETSVDFQRTTRRYIPQDSTLKLQWIFIFWTLSNEMFFLMEDNVSETGFAAFIRRVWQLGDLIGWNI